MSFDCLHKSGAVTKYVFEHIFKFVLNIKLGARKRLKEQKKKITGLNIICYF